eukprot:COSAG06_NODE_3727_length_4971_cov_2.507389_1_plen_75_part_00
MSNPLLVRPELAKVKNTTYTLPAPGHTYGKPMERDAEDASSGAHHPCQCPLPPLRAVLPSRLVPGWTDGLGWLQ